MKSKNGLTKHLVKNTIKSQNIKVEYLDSHSAKTKLILQTSHILGH